MKYLITFLIACLCLACVGRTKKETHEKENVQTEQSDSLVYVEKVVVDTVYFPEEKLIVKHIPQYKHDTVIVYRKGRANTKIIYRDGRMSIKTSCDSLSKLVLNKTVEIERLKRRSKNRDYSAKKKIQAPPWHWYLLIGLGILFTLVISIIVLISRISKSI